MSGSFLYILPLAGMLDSFTGSGLQGQVIVTLLIVGSIVTWTVMLVKYREMRISERETKRFLLAYRNDPVPVSLYLKRQKYAVTPLYPVYEKTCQTLGGFLEAGGANPSDLFMGGVSAQGRKISLHDLEGLQSITERTVAEERLALEKNIGFIGTAVAVTPLLGLLGTVWGFMNVFGNIAGTGMSTLNSIAPGIAGALLPAVVGLIVALPTTVAYGVLRGMLRRLAVALDNFSHEIIDDMERTYVEMV